MGTAQPMEVQLRPRDQGPVESETSVRNTWEEINFAPANDPGRAQRRLAPSRVRTASISLRVRTVRVRGAGARVRARRTGRQLGHRRLPLPWQEEPPLRGFYISGYFVSSRVWAAEFNGAWSTSVLVEPPSLLTNISSLGEDEAGELYVASFRSGIIFAIDGPGPAVVRNQAICKAPLLSI